jgi:hypothetical protein
VTAPLQVEFRAGGKTASVEVPVDLDGIPAPTITSFSAYSALPGAVVRVFGTNLLGATAARVNETAAPFTVYGDGEVRVTVQAGMTTGFVEIDTPSGTASSPAQLLVLTAGQFAYLAPTYTLPPRDDGGQIGYNTTTGMTEGNVFGAQWVTRAWLGTNSVTVKTIKASGGDYTPSQYQAAINAAAAANVTTTIVVDDGLVVPNVDCPAKSGTPAWTFTVCKSFWDGTWAPADDHILNVDTEVSRLFRIQQPNAINQPAIDIDGNNKDRYGWVGAHVRRSTAFTTSNVGSLVNIRTVDAPALANLPQEHVFRWCFVDGIWKEGATYFQSRRGIAADGYRCAVWNSVVTGFAGTGSDCQAIATFQGGGKLDVQYCTLEGAGMAYMCGGSGGNVNFVAHDFLFRNVWMIKRQNWNPASSLWDPAAPSPVVKPIFEIKHGERWLIEGCVFEGSWAQAQEGSAILIKCSGTGGTTSPAFRYVTNDVNIRLCKTLRHNTAIFTSSFEFITPESMAAGSLPVQRVDICGCIFEAQPAAHGGVANIRCMELNSNESANAPKLAGVPYEYGPWRVRNSTFVMRDTVTIGQYIIGVDPSTVYSSFDLSDCIFDAPNQYGINAYSTADSAAALALVNITPKRNVWFPVLGGNDRSDYQTPHPEQYSPAALWLSGRVDWVDFAGRNYTLSSSSPLKGLAAGGRDPGAPTALTNAATSWTRMAPSYIPLEFV